MQAITFDSLEVTFDSLEITFDIDSNSTNPILYIPELRMRLQNPAVLDNDLLTYVKAAQREVKVGMYSIDDYDAQILDTACQMLAIDGKFPEISSITSGGVSTSFSPNDPERYRRKIAARRSAYWMKKR